MFRRCATSMVEDAQRARSCRSGQYHMLGSHMLFTARCTCYHFASLSTPSSCAGIVLLTRSIVLPKKYPRCIKSPGGVAFFGRNLVYCPVSGTIIPQYGSALQELRHYKVQSQSLSWLGKLQPKRKCRSRSHGPEPLRPPLDLPHFRPCLRLRCISVRPESSIDPCCLGSSYLPSCESW